MTMFVVCLAGVVTVVVISYLNRSMARLQRQRIERGDPQNDRLRR